MNTSIKKKINRIGLMGRIFSWVSIALLFIVVAVESQYAIAYDVEFLLNAIAKQPTFAGSFGCIFRLNAILVIGSCIAVNLISLDGLSAELRRCDTPFSDAVTKRLNGYARTRFICTTILFVTMLVSRILNTWSIPAVGIVAFASGIAVSILFSVIVMLLTRSFRYGAQSQTEDMKKTKTGRIGLAMQIITIAMVLLTGISCVASILFETGYPDATQTISWLTMGRNPLPSWISILSNGLLCMFGIVSCMFQMRVASGFRSETSNTEDTLRRINLFAKVLLLCTGAAAVVKIIFSILSRPYNLTNTILGITTGNIFGALYSAALILLPFFAGLVMLFLTKVFRRGAQLPEESDKTL